MHKLATVAATLFGMMWSPANAEMNGATRIGVLNDMSSVYSDFQGPGSVVAAQMAAEEFAKQSKRKVEILSADHQNKPDIGAETARRWFDVEGVDMIIDVPNSPPASVGGRGLSYSRCRRAVARHQRTRDRIPYKDGVMSALGQKQT
jgi:ABC-type branched-subunit amino acid transport system substrate-binding protein